MDVPMSFLTGVLLFQGTLEMRAEKIAMHYVRTWLLFDVIIVCTDRLELIYKPDNTAIIPTSIRLLRVFRLISRTRQMSTPQIVKQFEYYLRSERLKIIIGI